MWLSECGMKIDVAGFGFDSVFRDRFSIQQVGFRRLVV
jgi:hypothetical protein